MYQMLGGIHNTHHTWILWGSCFTNAPPDPVPPRPVKPHHPTHPITPTTACKKPAANMALKEFFVSIFSPFFLVTETHPSWEFQHPIFGMIKEDMLASKLNWEETWNELIFSLQNSKPSHVLHAPSIFAFSNDQMFFSQYKSHGILTHIFGESHRNVADLQENTETACSFLTNKQQVNDTTLNTQKPL